MSGRRPANHRYASLRNIGIVSNRTLHLSARNMYILQQIRQCIYVAISWLDVEMENYLQNSSAGYLLSSVTSASLAKAYIYISTSAIDLRREVVLRVR